MVKKHLWVAKSFECKRHDEDNVDMCFCENMRGDGVLMNILNTSQFGSFNYKSSEITLTSHEDDTEEWKAKYLHPDFLDPSNAPFEVVGVDVGEPVIRINAFSEQFCKELVQLAETSGEFTNTRDGEEYYDERISNKENYPTDDVHLNQLGLNEMFEWWLDNCFRKFMNNVYDYDIKGMNIAFVVKYSMDGQKELRWHHDSSTVSMNICLTRDFEGGGTEFRRQGLINNKNIGSMLIHSGRLYHKHRGVPITSGKRYILVGFID